MTTEALDRIADVLRARAGLDPTTLGPGAVADAAEARRLATGARDLEEYAARFASDDDERRGLLARVLVHETCFFRYPRSFDLLVQRVRERLAATAGPVRILSAGCSTGQEPATVVIALLTAGVPLDRVEVHAADVSESAVERGREGLYSRFEARGLSPELAAAWTTEVPQGCRLSEAITGAIRWRVADVLDPAFGQGEPVYDAVLCRNLIIYLTEDARWRLAATLQRVLRPGGLLLVGHAEVLVFQALGFTVAEPMDAYALVADALPARPRSAPRAATTVAKAPRSAHRAKPSRAATAASGAPGPSCGGVEPAATRDALPRFARAERLADAGRLTEARVLVEEDLAERGPTAAHFHLMALLARAEGRSKDADEALVKALYLDPRHVPSLVQAVLAAEARGDAGRAGLLRERLTKASSTREAR